MCLIPAALVGVVGLFRPVGSAFAGLNWIAWPLAVIWAAARAQDLKRAGWRWPLASLFCMLTPFFVAATLWNELRLYEPRLGVVLLTCYLFGSHRILNEKITALEVLGLLVVAVGQSLGALGKGNLDWVCALVALAAPLTLVAFSPLVDANRLPQTEREDDGILRA